MEREVKEKMLIALQLCIDITNNGVQMFFDYAPHVNFLDVYYYDGGFKATKNITWIAQNVKITEENLNKLIAKLEEVKEWGYL